MVRRSGRSSLGCLFTLLLLAAAAYFGVNIGEAYWRFYEFEDAMRQDVRFAAQTSDDHIAHHLAALADSLGLPADATNVTVARAEGMISIRSEYTERVEFPLFARDIRFRPHAEGRF